MTGNRKYTYALLALAALVGGFLLAAFKAVSHELFGEYVFGLFLLVAGFGGANGIEHIAGAVAARRGVTPKAYTVQPDTTSSTQVVTR